MPSSPETESRPGADPLRPRPRRPRCAAARTSTREAGLATARGRRQPGAAAVPGDRQPLPPRLRRRRPGSSTCTTTSRAPRRWVSMRRSRSARTSRPCAGPPSCSPPRPAPPSLRGGVAVHPNEAALHARGADHEGNPLIGLDEAIARGLHPPARPRHGRGGRDGTGLVPHVEGRRDGAHRPDRRRSVRTSPWPRSWICRCRSMTAMPIATCSRCSRRTGRRSALSSTASPGDAEFARACADRGYYLSFAGNVTFKNAG